MLGWWKGSNLTPAIGLLALSGIAQGAKSRTLALSRSGVTLTSADAATVYIQR
jgi:hypothetical protein